MSNKITKRQHYVWRNYLRAWSENDSIFAFVRQKNTIIRTDLMNVAQKRYFNKFDKFGKVEKDFLDHIASKIQGPIKPMIDNLIFDINLFNDFKEIQEKSTKDIPEVLNELEKNGFEKFHTSIENYGSKLIACRELRDLYFFDDDISKYDALMYLCFQYFRTKKHKDSQIENFKNTKLDIEKIHNVLVIIIAAQLTQNISFDPKIQYCLLEIITDEISFITSDQPVINLLADELDENGNVKDLMLYYPISPKHAIRLEFNNSEDNKYQYYEMTVSAVEELNSKMVAKSHEFLISDSREQLKCYI
ncbi:hypothetical protein M2306_001773 [Myroides gitamensis]|uniref:DUF4238 domain-containing protein n=1 Tax=Myroides odoratus TaxID=256 RepID=UPI002167FFBA|nr:DUF4238 domain-containing protein [Myroides odoratus]MCS4240170.1 hypothetical protein [Myroides odoratus]MDH6601079.1 hypothetical protein [Myroides gitamensis]